MKYVFRVLIYLSFLILSFTIVSVVLLRFVPVSFTPLKVIALQENKQLEKDYPFRSEWISIDHISAHMVTAVVATEDNHFLKHNGFDFEAIQKALEENREGRRMRGGSTISQQTAKNVFCFPQRTWLRKGVETWFTFWIELCWNKKRIMEVYLNVIETHPNMYGVEATAQYFYKKTASDLNNYEAAMIATVLPSPRRMNIGAPSNYMTQRSARVRRLMGQVGSVDLDNPASKEENTTRK